MKLHVTLLHGKLWCSWTGVGCTASRVTWIALPTVTYATHNPPSRLYVYEWCVAWRCRGKRGPGYAEATTRRREPGNILLCRHPHFPHADTGWCSVCNDNVPEHHQVLDSANLPHYRHPLQASMGSKMSTMSQFCGEAGFSESSRLIFPHLPNPTANKKTQLLWRSHYWHNVIFWDLWVSTSVPWVKLCKVPVCRLELVNVILGHRLRNYAICGDALFTCVDVLQLKSVSRKSLGLW